MITGDIYDTLTSYYWLLMSSVRLSNPLILLCNPVCRKSWTVNPWLYNNNCTEFVYLFLSTSHTRKRLRNSLCTGIPVTHVTSPLQTWQTAPVHATCHHYWEWHICQNKHHEKNNDSSNKSESKKCSHDLSCFSMISTFRISTDCLFNQQ